MTDLQGDYRYRVALANGDSVDFLADGLEINDWQGGTALTLFIRDRDRDRPVNIAAWNTSEWKTVQMVSDTGESRSI